MHAKDILSVLNLSVSYIDNNGLENQVVDSISFSLAEGILLGITGESGSGKTTLLNAILNLLPTNGRFLTGEIVFNGQNFSSKSGMPRKYLGSSIGVVFQDSLAALDPLFTIGHHFLETIMTHRKCKKQVAKNEALDFMQMVNLKDPHRCYFSYPHQLSGGMRQRVSLALALCCRPKVLFADEPTSSLDLINAIDIMTLLSRLTKELHFSAVIVSHDINLILKYCDQLLILHQGRIIEGGKTCILKRNNNLHQQASKLINYGVYYGA